VTVSSIGDLRETWPFAVWDELRQRASAFDGALAFGSQRFDLADSGEADPVEGLYASGQFFSTLGVHALIGRTFTEADDVAGAGPQGPVAVISYGFWQRRFGGAADVVGRRLAIQRVPFTIIGVTPPEFFGVEVGRTFDVALPLGAERLIRGRDSLLTRESGNYFLTILFRLKPDRSREEAAAALRTMQPEIRAAAMPQFLPPDLRGQFLASPFDLVAAAAGVSGLRRQYERPLELILGVVSLVLLIACANLANLLLARATARRHEMSVRLALGAGRWRVARQVLVESLVLAILGAAAGLLLAGWGSAALVAQLSTADTRVVLDTALDRQVLAFTTIVTLATTVLFGAAPAWWTTRVAPLDAMKQQGRGASTGGRFGLSNALVVVQVALSLVLLVGAGLFVVTLARLTGLPRGFDADRILMVNVDVARTAVAPGNRLAFFHQLTAVAATVPGVAQAGASLITPVGGGGMIDDVHIDRPPAAPEEGNRYGLPPFWGPNSSMVNYVTPAWFATYGMALRVGRRFADGDVAGSAPVAVVNETFARKFFGNESPIGATVRFRIGGSGPTPTPRTVVGVVADALYDSLRGGVRPVVYAPLAQLALPAPRTAITISVRAASGPPAALAPSVAGALTAVDSNLAFYFRRLSDRIDATIRQERLVAWLSGFFGALALLVAGLGLYGVTAYTVTMRRAEFGIRLALGAGQRRIVTHVLRRVFVLVSTGVAAGVVVSVLLAPVAQSLLFGLEARNPWTLLAAVGTLAAVATLAGWLPAYRASRIDPAEVLREG